MKHLPTVLALSLVSSGAAMAQDRGDISYTYFELDYINIDLDDLEDGDSIEDFDDGSGYGIRGSFALGDNWFGFANYSETEADATFINDTGMLVPGNSDLQRFDIGLGFHAALNDRTDWVLSAAYTDLDIDDFSFGASGDTDLNDLFDDPSDGYFIDAALRSQLTTAFEGTLGVRYTDIESTDDVSLLAGVLWEFSDNMSINLSTDIGGEVRTWWAGLRFSF